MDFACISIIKSKYNYNSWLLVEIITTCYSALRVCIMAGGTEEIIINGAFRILDDKGHHFVGIQKIEEMYQLTPGSGKNYFAGSE